MSSTMSTSDDRPEVQAYLVPKGDRYEPTWIAQGPWGNTMAGHVIGGLLGAEIERTAGDSALQPARLTVDLLRPTLMEPVQVSARITRDGRRIRLAEAELTQGGTLVGRASAVLLRRGEQPEQQVWSSPVNMPPLPVDQPANSRRSPFVIRAYGWGPDAPRADPDGPAAQQAPVPKYAWVRETKLLIDKEPLTPFTRAAMAGDVTNPLTHWGTAGMQYINADYTLTLSRLPVGSYVGLAAQTHSSHEGVATGVATLFDEQGPIGSSMATALADARFRSPFTT